MYYNSEKQIKNLCEIQKILGSPLPFSLKIRKKMLDNIHPWLLEKKKEPGGAKPSNNNYTFSYLWYNIYFNELVRQSKPDMSI